MRVVGGEDGGLIQGDQGCFRWTGGGTAGGGIAAGTLSQLSYTLSQTTLLNGRPGAAAAEPENAGKTPTRTASLRQDRYITGCPTKTALQCSS